jgi:hypothetical protein
MCRDGTCTFPTVAPELSEADLEDRINAVVDELMTPDGVAMLMAEELIESAPAMSMMAYSGAKLQKAAMKRIISRAIARRSAAVTAEGMVPVVSRSMISNATKNVSAYLARKGITSQALKMSTTLSTGIGALYFAIQVVGMVLDMDDAAGFNAQLSQGAVDMYMEKILQFVNEDPFLQEVGVQFPYEYLPQQTIEWRTKFQGDVADDTKHNLMLDYINKLDVNSNGKTIIRSWTPLDPTPETRRNPTLWSLSHKNERSYSFLSKWWWLILVLVMIVILTIGLGVGLSARKRRKI